MEEVREVIGFLAVLLLSRCIVADSMTAEAFFTHNPAYATAGYIVWAIIMIAYVAWRVYVNKQK